MGILSLFLAWLVGSILFGLLLGWFIQVTRKAGGWGVETVWISPVPMSTPLKGKYRSGSSAGFAH
jgi:hypothetical protein